MKAEDRYDSLIVWYAEWYGRDPRQVKRQLMVESGLNPDARNRKSGARGLAQFLEATWGEWGTSDFDDAYDPEAAIVAHCKYMKWLETAAGSLREALAAYNFGIGNVRKGKRWPRETERYVKACLAWEDETLVVQV